MQRAISLSTLKARLPGALLLELRYALGPCDEAGWSVQQLCSVFVPAKPPHFGYEHVHELLVLVFQTLEGENEALIGTVLVPKKQLVCFFASGSFFSTS